MTRVPTVRIYRGGEFLIVNESDRAQWLAAGWSLDQPAVEPPVEPATVTDPAPRKRRASKATEPITEPTPAPEADPGFHLDGL